MVLWSNDNDLNLMSFDSYHLLHDMIILCGYCIFAIALVLKVAMVYCMYA